jgi:hypothetical protein
MESKTSDDQSDEQSNKDIHLTTFNEVKKLKSNYAIQATSDGIFVSTESISTTKEELQLSRRGSLASQFSSIDPKCDRVSTILVWKNLTVQTSEDKRREFFQRFPFYKHFEPKRKVLLHNLNGAITGGLWAVMGKSLVLLFDIQFDSHRTFWFGQINSLKYIGMSFGCEHNCPR